MIGYVMPKCSMLIDQSLYIEEDGNLVPLGHTCYNEAKYSDGIYFYCEECRTKIKNGDVSSISLPPGNHVEMCNHYIEGMK